VEITASTSQAMLEAPTSRERHEAGSVLSLGNSSANTWTLEFWPPEL
jgi:hypothetical protein